MSRDSFRSPRGAEGRKRRGGRRLLTAAVVGSAAMGVPVLLHHWIRRRAEKPQAPRWGRAHRFSGRFGALAFQEMGEGSPLVLVHSFGPGHDSEQWRAAAEILAERHRVLVPDLPGWGRSGLGGKRLDAGIYVASLEEFLAGVAGEPAVVVAAGLPAAYAVLAAGAHPALFRALVLVGPKGLGANQGRGDTPWIANLLRFPWVSESALDALTSRPKLEQHLRQEVFAAAERVDAGLIEHHYRVCHRPAARRTLAAYWRGELEVSKGALAEAFAQIDLPVLLTWGREAVHPPVEAADLWKKFLGGAELEVLSGSGTLPHAETPALFCRALERFLERVEAEV